MASAFTSRQHNGFPGSSNARLSTGIIPRDATLGSALDYLSQVALRLFAGTQRKWEDFKCEYSIGVRP